ncbi:MAG: iron ABC transporter permease [Parvibaculum sp.]
MSATAGTPAQDNKSLIHRFAGQALGSGWFSIVAMLCSVIVGLLIIYPLLVVTFNVFIRDGASVPELLHQIVDDGLIEIFVNTVVVIGTSIVLAAMIGPLFAWLVERTDIGMAGLTRFLPMLPLLVPPIAGAIGWVLLASPRSGFLNQWWQDIAGLFGVQASNTTIDVYNIAGLVFVFTIYLVPNIFLTVSSHLRNLDPALEEAARISGAGVWKTLLTVTIPSVKPAIFAGMIIALIMGLSLFSLPAVIGTPASIELLAVHIVQLMIASYPPQTGMALLLALVLVAVIGTASWLQSRVLASSNFSTIGGRGIKVAAVQLGGYRILARMLLLFYVAISSVLPLFALVVVSVQPFWTPVIKVQDFVLAHYKSVFIDTDYSQSAVLNSIGLGIVGAALGMIVAAIIAFYIDRNRNTLASAAVDSVTKLPGAMSHLVIGIAFVVAFSGAPFFLYGTMAILLLAYIVLYIPQATLSASASLTQVGRQLTEAALMSGASQGTAFIRITLPLMLPGLVAGWTLLFVLMSGDITASAMLAGNRNPVVGFVILDLWANGSFPQLAALGTVTTLISSTLVLITMHISRQSMRSPV